MEGKKVVIQVQVAVGRYGISERLTHGSEEGLRACGGVINRSDEDHNPSLVEASMEFRCTRCGYTMRVQGMAVRTICQAIAAALSVGSTLGQRMVGGIEFRSLPAILATDLRLMRAISTEQQKAASPVLHERVLRSVGGRGRFGL